MAVGVEPQAHGPGALRVAIIGAGNIAPSYGRELVRRPEVELLGVTDLVPERANDLAGRLGVRAYPSLQAVLADPEVDAIVNLTGQRMHAAVTGEALEAGKHAYSEKPLAATYPEARDLVSAAEERGLLLVCAPTTLMGEAQQTAWKYIRDGRLGTVRVAYAEVNWGRIETWHPNPEPFYEIGVIADVGVYPLAILSAIFGPVRRVQAFGQVVMPDRLAKDGHRFRITTPEFVVAVLEMESGTLARLTANWYVMQTSKQEGMEFHGDAGSLFLSSWLSGDARVECAPVGEDYSEVALVRPAEEGVVWSRGVPELARARVEGRRPRSGGEQAAHLVEVMGAIGESVHTGAPVAVTSRFTAPAPMDWAV